MIPFGMPAVFEFPSRFQVRSCWACNRSRFFLFLSTRDRHVAGKYDGTHSINWIGLGARRSSPSQHRVQRKSKLWFTHAAVSELSPILVPHFLPLMPGRVVAAKCKEPALGTLHCRTLHRPAKASRRDAVAVVDCAALSVATNRVGFVLSAPISGISTPNHKLEEFRTSGNGACNWLWRRLRYEAMQIHESGISMTELQTHVTALE
jgi:hypothetical protein